MKDGHIITAERVINMDNNVSSIKIKGGIFEHDTTLPLFDDAQRKRRFCLVYGKNGSGKTTISRAFSKIAGNQEETIDDACLLDVKNQPLLLESDNELSTFVFNEDFVKNNVAIEESGLDTIVVMGARKEIDRKIKEIMPQLESARERFNHQINLVNRYRDEKDTYSPSYYLNQMMEKLKGADSWASRDAYINGKKQNTRVTTDTYIKFKDLQTEQSRDDLIIEFHKLSKAFEEMKSGSQIISEQVNTQFDECGDEFAIRKLLSEKIEQPNLSDREKKIFSIIGEKEGIKQLENIKKFFSDENHHTCPYCFQEFSSEYADGLVSSIEKILNKRVENHKNALEKCHQDAYEFDLSFYEALDTDKVKAVGDALQTLNSAINKVNEYIEQKKSNIYEVVILPEVKLKEKYDLFIKALKILEENRKEFNMQASDLKKSIQKLTQINNLIAMYDIKDMACSYEKQLKEQQNETAKLKIVAKDKNNYETKIAGLELEKKNARIAMEKINKDLRYIFFSRDRLFIEYKDDKYILYSHGKSVTPNRVSVGERNAIGLCYFFNYILRNKSENTAYNKPYLIVVDDPVSSFDMENKIGVLSYLKYALSKFALGNETTRFLIMTHDLQTFFDVKKIIDEILHDCSSKYNGREGQDKRSYHIFELTQASFKECNSLDRHEYTALMEQIYEYAKEPLAQYSMVIGNMMRKTLEAFGTFLYRKGIDMLSIDSEILDELEEPYRMYFRNLMYRLVLNGESHMKDRVQTIDDMDFYEFISDSEKQRTAKDILCFMYKLNEKHVMAHLSSKPTAKDDIMQWCIENIEILE